MKKVISVISVSVLFLCFAYAGYVEITGSSSSNYDTQMVNVPSSSNGLVYGVVDTFGGGMAYVTGPNNTISAANGGADSFGNGSSGTYELGATSGAVAVLGW